MSDEVRGGVACRLVINGQVIEFTLEGPLVTMPAKPVKKNKGRKA